MNSYKRIYEITMTVILLGFILIMFLLGIISPTRVFSESENRMLQGMPELSLSNILDGDFIRDYEKYIADQTPGRDMWISIKSQIERLIGKKENNGVYLGSDGFLLQSFNSSDKENLESRIAAINLFAKKYPKLKKYLMLVPNSAEILKDKLPPFAPDANQRELLDRVEEQLDSEVDFIDVYSELYKNRDEYIYYKTDHHWTTKGAYYGYRVLASSMGLDAKPEDYYEVKRVTESFYGSLFSKSGFRDINPDSIDLYVPRIKEEYEVWYGEKSEPSNSVYNMNNINKRDKYTVFQDGNHPVVTIKTKVKNDKRLLIIKDSYANSLLPFLTTHFSEIYMVDLRYLNDSLEDIIELNNINEVVILYNMGTFLEESSIKRLSW